MPLKVSFVCAFRRLRRCGRGGGDGRAWATEGRATAPAINERNWRRSIVPDLDCYRQCVPDTPTGPEADGCYRRSRHVTKHNEELPDCKDNQTIFRRFTE